MSSRKIISMTLLPLFLLISYSCNNNPLDKKFADTNYIEVLDELQQKNIITKEERTQMLERIVVIISIKYGTTVLPESAIYLGYGVPFEKLTYRDIYNSCCLEKESKP